MRPTPRMIPLAFLTASVLALVFGGATTAAAEEEVDWARTGAYIGVSVVGGTWVIAPDEYANQFLGLGLDRLAAPPDPEVSDDLEHDMSIGYDFYVGYRLHKFLAVEVEFERIAGVEFDVNAGTLLDADTWNATTAARLIWPMGRFEPFIIGGFGVMAVDLNQEITSFPFAATPTTNLIFEDGFGFVGRFGGGFEFHLSESITMRATTEWIIPTGDIHEMEYASIGGGLAYRF